MGKDIVSLGVLGKLKDRICGKELIDEPLAMVLRSNNSELYSTTVQVIPMRRALSAPNSPYVASMTVYSMTSVDEIKDSVNSVDLLDV